MRPAHSVFNRAELARQILWKDLNPREECRRRGYRPREVEVVAIFGSRSELPSSSGRHPLIHIFFLDELLEALEARDPHSPLVAALAPLRDPLPELEKNAAGYYDQIRQASALRDDDREVLTEIFVNLLLQRFQTKSREEIRKMIAQLTPLHKTRAGKELLEKGIEKGIETGRVQGERAMVLRLLGRKFPEAVPVARPMVEALDEPGLRTFGEALLFFGSQEDCLAWLERARR